MSLSLVRFRSAAIVSLLAVTAAVQAQTAITSITTVTSDLADVTANGNVHQNTTVAITGFATATTTYSVGGTAVSAFIRRNNVNANNTTADCNEVAVWVCWC